ncbi:F-box protein CPR1-like [Silene latifolia]|uniref:F-box protein CPR1-like n=1 Tax=Silene latifolia TaxID=37657 RepID=UPI003D780E5B
MAMLPLELILEEILPKLPAKSLLRFKCVSKHFQIVISSPNFILHHSLGSATSRLLITSTRSGLHYCDLEPPENPLIPLPIPEFFKPGLYCQIIGCCNGLLLLGCGNNNTNFLLMNPSTGFYTVIPGGNELVCYCNYGFGYDAINDDYKIVIFDGYNGLHVANLKDKLWRYLGDDDLFDVAYGNRVAAVFDNHLCHWLVWCELQNKHRIICFHLCFEIWTTEVPLPDFKDNAADNSGTTSHFANLLVENCRDGRNDVTALHVLDGFLSVLTQSKTVDNGYDVWVMKEYGIKESWVKLFGFSDSHSTPLAFGRGSSSKVLCKVRVSGKYRVKWYNVREKQYNNAEIYDVHGVEHLYQVCVVNGSLLTVPGGKRIRDNGRVDSESGDNQGQL